MKGKIDEDRRRLRDGVSPPRSSPVQIFGVKGQEADLDDESYPFIDGWDLESVDSEGMVFTLNMQEPLSVSSGDNPDLLLV